MTGPLQHLVSSRSWEWLRALCGPMSLEVQLLDLGHAPVPLFSARPGAPPGPLDHDAIRRLRPATEAVVTLQAPQVAHLGTRVVALLPVRIGGAPVGVMLVAHAGDTASVSQGQLASLSAWLRTAVEQHLASQVVAADHLAALHHALRGAAFDGSDRRLVSVFAEALAVWHDIEVVGYVETAPGVFTRAVSLAGRGDVPPLVFPTQAVPAPQRLTRMPQTHVDGGDRGGAADSLVVTLTRSAGAIWLLTLSGEIDACDPALLAGYVSALDLTLALTTRAASARTALAVASDLSAGPADSPHGLQRALDRVRHALGAGGVHFSVQDSAGTPRISARAAGVAPAAPGAGPQLTIERRTQGRGLFALSIERAAASPWTPAEHAQARAAADILEAWVEQRDAPPAAVAEATAFAHSIDERVARAVERGDAITLALFVCAPALSGEQADGLVTECRRFLRDGDEVGVLENRELVFLLQQTTSSQAPVVTRRLKANLARAAAAEGIAIVAEGFATRMPGHAGVGLLREARARIGDSGPARG